MHGNTWLPSQRYAFVIMPYGHKELDLWYHTELVQKLSELDIQCYRAKDLLPGISGRAMLDGIHELILRAEIVIAELTQANMNVLYELGFAQAAGKDPIVVATDRRQIPSDLQALFTCDRAGIMAAVHSRLAGLRLGALVDFILPVDSGPIYVLAGPKEPTPGAPVNKRTYGDYLGVKKIPALIYRVYGDTRACEVLHCLNVDPEIVRHPNNIFSIGSVRNNRCTGELMDRIQNACSPVWYIGSPRPEDKRQSRAVMCRRDGDTITQEWHAPDWDVAVKAGKAEDVGLILRAPHPADPQHRKQVVVLAGPSSLGTAAACEAATSPGFAVELAHYLGRLTAERGGRITDRERSLWVQVNGYSDTEDLHLDRIGLADAGFLSPIPR